MTLARPRLWKYLLAGIVLMPFAAAAVLYAYGLDEIVLRYEQGKLGVLGWLALPLALLLVAFGWRWAASESASARVAREQAAKVVEAKATEAKAITSREFSLEVLSLGLSIDKYRQATVWEQLGASDPVLPLVSTKPEDYPSTAEERRLLKGKRATDVLEHAAAWSPVYWGLPSFGSGPPATDPTRSAAWSRASVGVGNWQDAGMHWHMFAASGRRFAERPDGLLSDVFDFLETNPDVPYVLVFAADSDHFRERIAPSESPRRVKDGYYVPQFTDTDAAFILARRDRVEALRRFAVEDKELQTGIQHHYIDLSDKLQRIPTGEEWLAAAKEYAATEPWKRSPHAAKLMEWRPTPWFPVPWTTMQFLWFDRLPLVGYLHRPQFVSFKTAEGEPMKSEARAEAFKAGWQAALATLPGEQKPARVFYATGKDAARVQVLSQAMNEIGPKFELYNNKESIDFDKRLGDTGAATFFAQIAIGVVAGYRDGGITAAVNLRDPEGASIVMVRPPPTENRKPHPAGGDVFRYGVAN